MVGRPRIELGTSVLSGLQGHDNHLLNGHPAYHSQPPISIHAAFNSFLKNGAHRSAHTITTLNDRVGPFTEYLARVGVQDALSISREHVDGFLAMIAKGRTGKPLAYSTLYDFTKSVKAFCNHIADNLAPDDWRNPVRRLPAKPPQTVIRPLSHAQVRALLNLVDTLAPTAFLRSRNKAVVYLLLDGALRIGELLGANRDDLHDDGALRVIGKGAKEREVSLSSESLAAVREYLALRKDKCPRLIVADDGQPITYDGVKDLFHYWKQESNGQFTGVRLSAHTLRHTSATMRRMAGMSEGDLQTFLGHATPAMTRHYSQFALAKAANAAAVRTSPMLMLV